MALSIWLAVATATTGTSSAIGAAGDEGLSACAPQQLLPRLDMSPGFVANASGEAVWTVLLVNGSGSACTLEGWPKLSLIAASGAPRAAAQIDTVTGAFGEVEPTRVTLRPSGTAAFFAAAPPATSCADPFRLTVDAALAHPATTLDTAAKGLRICRSGERIEVSAVHPAWVRLFHDYPGVAGPLDPAALQHAGFPACRARDLRQVRSAVEHPSSNGYEEVELFLRNAGAGCSISSRWPVVSLAEHGTVLVPAVRDVALLPPDVVRFGGSQSPPRFVDLRRGGHALLDILVRNPLPSSGCRRAATIEVRFDITPGTQWSSVPAASYRPAVGIPLCAGAEATAGAPEVSVTPITAAPDATHPLAQPARPAIAPLASSDKVGFGFGSDSSGGVCTGGTYPFRVEGLAKYGIEGPCAGYFGQVGASWSLWPGCPDSGWGWNSTDAAEAAANYPKYGVGNSFIYFTGGPGMMPPSVGTLSSWADTQIENFASQAKKSLYAGYVDEPVIILDVEVGYGWNDTVTDPDSGTVGCAFPLYVSSKYSSERNKELLADMVSEAATVFPGYEVVVYTGGRYDWDRWFASEAWKGGEYTFVNGLPGAPDGSSGNLPGKFCLRAAKTPCAQFWGHQSSSSSGALLWQWASPVAPSTSTMDIDQIDESHFPTAP